MNYWGKQTVGRGTFPGTKWSHLALDTLRNVFYSEEREVQDTWTAGTIHFIRLLRKLLSKCNSSGLLYDIAPPQEGPSFSQAPDRLFLSILQLVGSMRHIGYFSHFIKCKMLCFVFEANTQSCLSSHFSVLFFIAKSNLEAIACNFLRNGFRMNRHAVCVPFECVGVQGSERTKPHIHSHWH